MKTIVTVIGLALAVFAAAGDDWSERLKPSGDLRLRWEGFQQDGAFDDGHRDRFRYRARLKLEAEISETLSATIALRSGSADNPVSANVTLEGGFDTDDFNISQASLRWTPRETVTVLAGKFDASKTWEVTDLAWDSDVMLDGFLQSFEPGAWRITTFQLALDESSSGNESYLLGGQLARSFEVGSTSLEVAGGYEVTTDADEVAQARLGGSLRGNPMSNLRDADGHLVSDFEVAHLRFAMKRKIGELPIAAEIAAYRNLGAAGAGEDLDSASYARFSIGDGKKATPWRVRYTWYQSEPDALLFAYVQSDTSFGTDIDSHRLDGSWRFGASTVGLTLFHNEYETIDSPAQWRWQLDWSVKF